MQVDGGRLQDQIERLRGLSFQIGTYRPPSEGGSFSLLLRVTENCPWNQCAYCNMYKGQPFARRAVEEVKADIDAVAAIRDAILEASQRLGLEGKVTRELGAALLAQAPDLGHSSSFVTVFNWLFSGGETAFMQDADSLVMGVAGFTEMLRHLRKTLPSLTRVTSYARSKTLARHSLDQLRAIREAGLERIHIGLESGDDAVLAAVRKGVTQAEQIKAGRMAIEAGFQVSQYWMPDLGGRERWREHAVNTAAALSAVNPHYIRSRPFVPMPHTPALDTVLEGRLRLSSPHERLEELELMIGNLDVTSRVCFDHGMNAWADRNGEVLFRRGYEGYRFPDEKPLLLERIREGLSVDESMHVHVHDLMAAGSL